MQRVQQRMMDILVHESSNNSRNSSDSESFHNGEQLSSESYSAKDLGTAKVTILYERYGSVYKI